MPNPGGRPHLLFAPALVVAALLLRLAALAHPPPLNTDEARYLITAHHLATGIGQSDWRGPETHIHPLHPWLTSLWAGRDRASLESRGRLVTLLASVLFLAPLAALAWRLGGLRAALLLLLLLAVDPGLVRAAVTVEPESLYVLLVGSALCLLLPVTPLSPVRWAASGLLFGLSYLTRPEGFLVGFLAGGVALFQARRSGRRALAGAGLFAAALLATASPFLLFIHRTTGEWMLTGKSTELFFIGQALHAAGETPPQISELLALERGWKGIAPYARAHPIAVLSGALRNGLQIAGSILPRALGAAGLLGLAMFLLLRRRDLRGPALLVLSPSLTFFLMLFTFPNARVAGSVLPFLLVVGSLGLSAALEHPALRGKVRRAAPAVLLILAVAGWEGAAARRWKDPRPPEPPIEQRAAERAVREAGDAALVASNHPVFSFYTGDPLMFGPPGRYRLLPSTASCGELAAILRERRVRVAIMVDADASVEAEPSEGDCPLRPVFHWQDPEQGRVVTIYVLYREALACGPIRPGPRPPGGRAITGSLETPL